MFKEIIPSIKSHLSDRLSNPILGTFSFSWIFFNWKVVLFLFLSKDNIENKISVIESNYSNIETFIVYPVIFTIVYLLFIPWLLLGVQILQETANGKRRKAKTISDTNDIIDKTKLLTANTEYKKIQFEHELFMDTERTKRKIEIEQENMPHDIQMEREKRQLDMEFNQQKMALEEQKHRTDFDMKMEERRENFQFEEQKRSADFDMKLKLEEQKQKSDFEQEK